MRLTRIFRAMATIDISALRLKYNEKTNVFLETDIPVKDPIVQFQKWFKEACETPEILEPNGMCLSTATKTGLPSSRWVLMKGVCNEGFTFFTNYESRKAKEMAENPNVAVAFYWLALRRSVRIEGVVEKISREDSDKYFYERPRPSQIGALASPQSQKVPSREYLDKIENDLKEKIGPDGIVPVPNWGGYLIRPHTVEFWQGQSNRLHDRIRFRKNENTANEVDNKLVHQGENGWIYERLAP